MPKLLVIADDLTGSLDTGVQFSKRGADTLVRIMEDDEADLNEACEVLVVNTDSRHVSPERAYERVARLVRRAPGAGFSCLFKKTDSMLRGNIGSELAALLENGPEDELIFMPAFPKSGRFTIRGKQYLGDVPLTRTAFADDPFNPVRHDAVSAVIQEQTDLTVRSIHYDRYEELKKRPENGKSILVVDGRSDGELLAMGALLKESDKLRCLAGCAGFAELLPDLLGFWGRPPRVRTGCGSRLLVSGSINPLAQRQVAYAIDRCGYEDRALSAEQKLGGSMGAKDRAALEAALKSSGKLAVWSNGAGEAVAETDAKAALLRIPPGEIPGRIAGSLGGIAKALIRSRRVRSLIVFGGDTLLGIARSLNCDSIRPVSEVLPGVVLARFVDDRLSRLDIVTKAGGFGGEDVVARIDAFLDEHAVLYET